MKSLALISLCSILSASTLAYAQGMGGGGGGGGPMGGGGPGPGRMEAGPRGPRGMRHEMEKAAFMGLAVSPASPALAEQLQLPRGTGLVVDFVEPDGPGAKAGVKQHDVLRRLDDQILTDPRQFAILVRLQKPGDSITLTLLRQGQEQAVTVALEEREMPPLDAEGRMIHIPPIQIPDLRHLEQNRFWGGPSDMLVPPPAEEGTIVELKDPEHHLRITTDQDGQRHLLARDAEGEVLFDGPIETEQQRGEIPAAVREKLNRLPGAGPTTRRSPAQAPEHQTDERM